MTTYAQYDITENDPYLIPGSECLQNLLGITDTKSLNQAEENLTRITLAQLDARPIEPTFDLNHLCLIHQGIFEDVYPFAGQIRHSEIMKGGKLFLPYDKIKGEADSVFDQLHNEGLLQELAPRDFGKRAGFYLGRINMIHSFREGNGRAQRVLLNQLASLNNYAIEWAAISGEAMAIACREARTSDFEAQALQRLISLHTVDTERT